MLNRVNLLLNSQQLLRNSQSISREGEQTMSKLIHARYTENGDSGWNGKAKAGDQTGNEVSVTEFYIAPWDFALRYFNWELAKEFVVIAKKLAGCVKVGYDQSQRNDLYKTLKSFNFDVDKYILSGQKCETDCSAFVYACLCCLLPNLRSDANAPTTSKMEEYYKNKGFTVLKGSDYLNGKKNITGDIMVKAGHHTAIFQSDVDSVAKYPTEVESALTIIAQAVLKGTFGNMPERKDKIYRAVQDKVNSLVM